MANGNRRRVIDGQSLLGGISDDVTRTVSRLSGRGALSPGTAAAEVPHQRQLRQISFLGGAPGTFTDPTGFAQFTQNLGRQPGTEKLGTRPQRQDVANFPLEEGVTLPPSEEAPVSSVTATAPGAVPFGKGGTVSTFDDSLALGRLQAANRIRQGFIDERDARAQQRRLQDLAFNTPATIDNIAAIKGAQKQLLGETEAQGTTAAARAKAQAGQQLTAKERADIGFKERQENRADKEFGLKALAERRKGGQQFANQRRENERRIDQRTQSTVGRLAGSVEEGVEGREVNQARIDRVNALLASSAGKGLVAGEGFDDRDLSIITNLPDLTAVFADALKREGGIDFGPFQAADTLGTQANIRDVLNSIGGFERDTVLGGTVLSEFLGEGRNINLNVAGGGTEDIDFEAFINKSSGTTADQRARALQAFQILTTRGHPTAEALINKVLSPEEAEEYWNRVTTNAPGRVVRGGSPERLGG